MARYDTRCTNEDCKHECEISCKMSEKDNQKCPKCGALLKTIFKARKNGVLGFAMRGETDDARSKGFLAKHDF